MMGPRANEKTAVALPGNTTAFQNNQSPNPTIADVPESSSEISTFRRLVQQFAAVGLNLYPLDGQTLLVSSPQFGLSKTLPDLRAAKLYLAQIGGRA